MKDAIVEIVLRVLGFLFCWNKQSDAAGPGKDEKKLDESIKKDGW
jgi:hypothetical protein